MYSTKSIPFDLLFSALSPLVSLDLINLHSLQIGQDSSSILPYVSPTRIFDWSSSIHDFTDTAILLSQLDLVISIDSAVAHLSASMNCPTWFLLPFDCDFRWLLDRQDSPWYPKVSRLFRQTSQDDWESVIVQLQAALNRLFLVDIPSLLANSK